MGGEDSMTDWHSWVCPRKTRALSARMMRTTNADMAVMCTGKRIVDFQTSIALLNAPKMATEADSRTHDEYGRALFQHPALDRLENLTEFTKAKAVDKKRLAQLAEEYGMMGVIRWVPRKVCTRSLRESTGANTVTRQII